MSKIKTVFWDIDGTLVDSEPLHQSTLERVLIESNLAIPKNLHQMTIGLSASSIYASVREQCQLHLDFDAWTKLRTEYYLEEAHKLLPRGNSLKVYDLIANMGIQQVFVSNSDRLLVSANLQAVGLMKPGLKSVSSNDVLVGKPNSEAYLRAAYLVGAQASECIVIEDSSPGAIAGISAGMKTLFWPETNISTPAGAVKIEQVEELLEYLCD